MLIQKFFFLTVTAACLTLGVQAHARPPVEPGTSKTTEVEVYFSLLGNDFSYSVSEGDLVSTPDWANPADSEPPLDLKQAISISRAELVKYLPKVTEWKVTSIELNNLGDQDKWLYVIGWHPKWNDQGDDLDIPVLMDGRPVSLQRRK